MTTALYCGSNPERQSVGDPGHCERCAEVGHVIAHPDLGCGDVGCTYCHEDDLPSISVPVPDGIVWVASADDEYGVYGVFTDPAEAMIAIDEYLDDHDGLPQRGWRDDGVCFNKYHHYQDYCVWPVRLGEVDR